MRSSLNRKAARGQHPQQLCPAGRQATRLPQNQKKQNKTKQTPPCRTAAYLLPYATASREPQDPHNPLAISILFIAIMDERLSRTKGIVSIRLVVCPSPVVGRSEVDGPIWISIASSWPEEIVDRSEDSHAGSCSTKS